MVKIGIIGLGFMGMTHFAGAQDVRGGKVAAIATRNPKKLKGDWSSIQGNFGPRGSKKTDLTGVSTYSDYHDLLADDSIDLVDICLPTDQHEEVMIEAAKAGKNVIVEKPIAIEPKAAERMVKAADKAGVVFMVAQVLPFFPEFRWAADCVNGGKYGKLLSAHFRRVITPPDWSKDMADMQKLGGWGVDLHIHDNHFICCLCGTPEKVFSRGILDDGLVSHVTTQYMFDDPEITISCVSGGIAASGLKFGNSFEIFLEEATLQYDAGTYGNDWVVNRPLTLITNRGRVTTPKPTGGSEWYSAFTLELQAAVDAVNSGDVPTALSAELARDALKICHAEAKSIASGKIVRL